MTRRRPLIARFLLTLLVILAISFQGVPLVQAERANPIQLHAAMPDEAPPCHDMTSDELTGDPAPRAPQPAKGKSDSFACCAIFACGMLVQALPPEGLPARLALAAHFDRPPGLNSLAPGIPDSAWRPPSFHS